MIVSRGASDRRRRRPEGGARRLAADSQREETFARHGAGFVRGSNPPLSPPMGFPEPFRPPTVDPTAFAARPPVPWSVRLGCLLAWLGVCICLLLLQGETALRSWLCPVRGGCETVLSSQYADL